MPVSPDQNAAYAPHSVTEAHTRTLPAWCCPEHRCILVESGDALECPEGHKFTGANGIFRFVEDTNYAAAFGVQWNKYRNTQLDSHTGTNITRGRMMRCFGPALWAELAGKQILECGCGAGRFTEILLSAGGNVTSIDLSSAVVANCINFPPGKHHRIAQADILRLPFFRGQFDVVMCLGVIQHTPNPEACIEKLWEQVKPGGALVIDHYTGHLGWYTRSAPLFRTCLRRLPPEQAMVWTERLVQMFWPLHRAAGSNRFAQLLLSRISPVRCYYHSLPQLNEEMQYQWALLDTHDALTDWYKHRRSRDEIRGLFEALGAKDIWCEYGGNGVEARGVRPTTQPQS